jgi:hypothetical protein
MYFKLNSWTCVLVSYHDVVIIVTLKWHHDISIYIYSLSFFIPMTMNMPNNMAHGKGHDFQGPYKDNSFFFGLFFPYFANIYDKYNIVIH